MENITFDLLHHYAYGSAFPDYLALRKRFFVDNLKWGIPHNQTVEMDQYDNPLAHYSLVLRDGEVIAGARALPTTATWGDHSYMLRDAARGKLSDIPAALIDYEIRTPDVWECTRLVISDKVTTNAERMTCLDLIVDGLVQMAERQGGEQLMSLSNLWLQRALRRLGYDCELMCEPYVNADDGHKYAVMAMPTLRNLPQLPQATHRPQPTPLHAPAVA
jgi:acyl homoserine lactone synthase